VVQIRERQQYMPSMHLPPVPPPPPRVPAWAAGLIGALFMVLVVVVAVLVMRLNQKPTLGAVAIDARPPEADILVNDRLVANRSPFTIDLDAGNYVITVRAAGYKDIIRPVRVEAGVQVQETFLLEREKGRGEIMVETEPPGLAVFVDGESTGKVTPAKIDGLHSGTVEVMLKRDDGSIVHRARMTIDDAGPAQLSIDTRRLRPILDVTSTPDGARVIVDGNAMGTTPLTIPGLQAGAHAKVRLEKPGCEPFESTVPMQKATVSLVQATLSCGQAATASQGTGRISITASVVAEVFVDGRSFGKTPRFNMEIPAGTRVLRLVPEQGNPFETEVVIDAGAQKELHHQF
jgi:hypothetical protein